MTEPRRFKYLRPEDIRRLAGMRFAPEAMVEGLLAGRHRSPMAGSSIEFRDYRQYVPGDDRALVDWRVYARTDRYYLRTYEQETNLECHVFLDSSASMGFGAPQSKLEYASYFVATLCYLVIRNTDRVSLVLFDEGMRAFHAAGSTSTHLGNLMQALEENRPGSRTRLADALQRAYPLLKRRGSLVIVSDFMDDPAAIFGALSPFLHRGFRIHLFHILDPLELELPDRGLATFVDMESGQRVATHTDRIRSAYRDAMQGHVAGLRELAARRNVGYRLATTDAHYFSLFDPLVR